MVIFHYRVVVLDPVLSDAVHRRGEPPLAQLTWQQLMERFVSLTYTVALSQIVLPNTGVLARPLYQWQWALWANSNVVWSEIKMCHLAAPCL